MHAATSMSKGRFGPQDNPAKPSPEDFETFLPWACQQFNIPVVVKTVCNSRIAPHSPISKTGKPLSPITKTGKPMSKAIADVTSAIMSVASELTNSSTSLDSETIHIHCTSDPYNNPIKLNMLKIKQVPPQIIKILQLVIQFYPFLESLTINRGVDKSVIYEISKLLPLSNITDLCLDNSVIEQANYYILLDNPSKLNYLSLSKCKINDDVIQKIAERLEYPQPASKTLSMLYLSMNRITDVGVGSLAKALRSNRKLSYLNLAGNMISDNGANALFDVLLKFPLTQHEITEANARHTEYLKTVNSMIFKMPMNSQRSLKKSAQKKGPEENIYEKAFEHAKSIYGEQYSEMFVTDIVERNKIIYCVGNNTLAYISLAYNNLSQCTLKKIVKVLTHQKCLQRTPRGLVNLNLEGNLFENDAESLMIIDSMLDSALSYQNDPDGKNVHKKAKVIKPH